MVLRESIKKHMDMGKDKNKRAYQKPTIIVKKECKEKRESTMMEKK